MTRAMRDMEAKKDLCDGVICVLDARAPAATYNANLKKIFGSKPVLYLLNKSDLADGAKADEFVKLIESKGHACVKCDGTNISTRRLITQKLSAITKEKRERAEAKGLTKTFRFMVAGIPNTGKSTIVNLMSGQKKAKTGDKAGVTRDVRWLRCDGFDLLDTPGFKTLVFILSIHSPLFFIFQRSSRISYPHPTLHKVNWCIYFSIFILVLVYS